MIVFQIVAYDVTNPMGDNIMATLTDPLTQDMVDAAAAAAVSYLPQSAGEITDLSAYSGVRVVRTENVSQITADYPNGGAADGDAG